MTIEVQHLVKRFGRFPAVHDVSLRVEEGSLNALLGPSGSGKTTVLRMIAGLEVPDAGRIEIGGVDVSNVTAQKRNVGFVFQQYALFKHLRVEDNIAFPLKVRRWKRHDIRERVEELLGLLRLDGLARRYPDQISGGQRQRVALARALASRPQVLLLDEPFSALDARVRDELRDWLRSLHDQLHVTSLFVTHDQSEAMELADEIVIMNEGKIVQTGTPREITGAPNSPFVVNFLGGANALPGVAQDGVARIQGLEIAFAEAGAAAVPVTGYFRPHQVRLGAQPQAGALKARIERVVTTGLSTKVELRVDDGSATFVAELHDLSELAVPLEVGTVVYAKPTAVHVYATTGPVADPVPVAAPELVGAESDSA